MKKTWHQYLPGYLFLLPYATSYAAFIIVPFIVALVLAFLQFDLTSQHSVHFIGLDNFKEAFADQYFWKAVVGTLSFVVLMVPLQTILAMLLALGLHAMSNLRNTVRAILFLPGLLNVAVAAILWQWFYNGEFGLFAYLLRLIHLEPIPFLSSKWLAMPSIVLMSLWWTIGGTTVVLLGGLQQIPAQIFEAASIDGAGRWQTFWKVTLPMLKPVLLFITIMNTIGAFQVFGQPFLLTRGGPELSTRGVVQYIYETAFNNYRLGYGAALSWMLFAIIAIFALIQHLIIRRTAR